MEHDLFLDVGFGSKDNSTSSPIKAGDGVDSSTSSAINVGDGGDNSASSAINAGDGSGEHALGEAEGRTGWTVSTASNVVVTSSSDSFSTLGESSGCFVFQLLFGSIGKDTSDNGLL